MTLKCTNPKGQLKGEVVIVSSWWILDSRRYYKNLFTVVAESETCFVSSVSFINNKKTNKDKTVTVFCGVVVVKGV